MIAQPDLDSACLFLDVDGTLVGFALRPEQVAIRASLLETLARANVALGGAVAFVSGRPISALDEMFRPLKFAAAGVHGAELRATPIAPIVNVASPPPSGHILAEARRISAKFSGAFVENKGQAIAVHYRAAPWAAKDLTAAIEALVAGAADQRLIALHGAAVIEIKSRDFDKGVAIEQLMAREPFAFRSPIFIGDDTTDLPGFEAVLRLGGRAYSVGRRIPGLSGSFEGPDDVVAWLDSVSRQRGPAA